MIGLAMAGLTLTDCFQKTLERYPNKNALLFKKGDRYHSVDWSSFAYEVRCVAKGLLRFGLAKGERIALLSENRPEWVYVDMAALRIGAVTVPLYISMTPEEIAYILNDAGVMFIAVSNLLLLEKIRKIKLQVLSLKKIIFFEETSLRESSEDLLTLSELKKQGGTISESELEKIKVSDEEVATFLYTSGTTGQPKGVILTHKNFVSNIVLSLRAIPINSEDVYLSFLPLSHVFERMAGYYLMIYQGATIAYAENMDTVAKNLTEVCPTLIAGVPRFFEKVEQGIRQNVSCASFLRKIIFGWALRVGGKFRQRLTVHRRLSWMESVEHSLAQKLVYRKINNRLGGRLRFCISGGAALPRHVAEFFFDLGILILEGYGLSETSPVVSVNRLEDFRFGSVGKLIDGVEVRIASDGEILTRGECVMKGYYRQPVATSRAIDDEGWFHTGDLGRLDDEGFLWITGRKKEIIVTSGGKKIAPQYIEDLLTQDPLIARAVLYGEGKKFLTALIVPNMDLLRKWADREKLVYRDAKELVCQRSVQELIRQSVDRQCQGLASFEQIKYFALLNHDFSQDAKELTPTLKVRRHYVLEKYQSLLEPFYESPRD